MTWDAAQYLKFSDERSRPFFDLLAQVQRDAARDIVDLGCGTGHLTRSLADRWPTARVVGVDNSPAMLAKAQSVAIPGRLEFVQASIEAWAPKRPTDLIVSNAALHWVPDHASLLARLASWLAPGGTLAVQVPNRFQTPNQAAIDQTVAEPRWAAALHGVGLHRESVQPIEWYVQRLIALGCDVNAWNTTYAHVLRGENPVLEWLKGSALQALLERLPPEDHSDFLRDVGRRLHSAYPAKDGITLFPFPRLFFVATKGR